MNSRRHSLVLLALLLICSTLPGAQTARPNVLFIAVDDLNDWVSIFGGHPKAATPHMDRLARNGAMVFQNAHCAGSVCCPSRSAMLSGFMPSRSGIYSDGTEELYDLQADSQEWHNLIGEASSAGKAAMRRLGGLLPKTFAEPIPYSKGKYPKAKHLDTTIKANRNLATLK